MKKKCKGNLLPYFKLKLISKKFLIMKVSVLLTLITTLHVSASLYSQNAKLTLDMKDKPLVEVIKTIEQQSAYRFFFSDNYRELKNLVTINVKDESINDVLTYLLEEKSLTYRVMENNIVVIAPTKAFQQQKVTGIITDALSGEALIGVNIVVEGTTIGVISDLNGKFTIELPNSNAVLLVSYIGYLSEKVSVSGKSSLEVKLTPDIKKLDEIVVIGYGSVKKADVTGSVKSLSNESFNSGISMAPEQLMQGKVAGVNITMQSGEPGANSDVLIRGANSISHSNAPLYVIDGVPVGFQTNGFNNGANDRMTTLANNPLNMLNPSDIETINILKESSL